MKYICRICSQTLIGISGCFLITKYVFKVKRKNATLRLGSETYSIYKYIMAVKQNGLQIKRTKHLMYIYPIPKVQRERNKVHSSRKEIEVSKRILFNTVTMKGLSNKVKETRKKEQRIFLSPFYKTRQV